MSQVYTLSELANHLGGQFKGDPETPINHIAAIDQAGPEAVTFLSDTKYSPLLKDSKAGAVLVSSQDASLIDGHNVILVEDPYSAAIRVAALFDEPQRHDSGISKQAIVHKTAHIDSTACIEPFAVIEANASIGAEVYVGNGAYIGENVTLGAGSVIQPNVTIHRNSQVGEQVLIKSGAVLGGIGYGLQFDNQKWSFIPHLGHVIIGNNVSIGSCSTIDRGSFKNTVIEEGVKIDNQVQIAHNVHIGANTVIAGCAGIAGSCDIGRFCMIGGGVRFRDHVSITDQVQITGGSVLGEDITEPGAYSNCVFRVERTKQWFKKIYIFDKLEQLYKSIKKLEKKSNVET